MWGYVIDTFNKSTDKKIEKYVELLNVWEANKAKIITWINNFVEYLIGMQLEKHEMAKEVWDHLARLYTQSNFAKQYQLELDIRTLEQKNINVQQFYSAMIGFLDQLALTKFAKLQAFGPYITPMEEQRLVQFFMALYDEFEGFCGSILHRIPLPSIDSIDSELLAEEIQLKSQAKKSIILTTSILAMPSRPPTGDQSKSNLMVVIDECSFFK